MECKVRSVKCGVWSEESATPATRKRHDNLLGNLRKGEFLRLPPKTRRPPQEKPETRDETHGCRKTSISCETSSKFDMFNTLSNSLECHKVPRLPRKNDMTSRLGHIRIGEVFQLPP